MGDDLIICTRNRPAELARCLASVLDQTRLPTCTTVVDSSDGDDSKQLVHDFTAQWPGNRRLVYVESEPGLTRQRAVGLRSTQERIVHFVDDDTVLEPGYIAGIDATFEADAGETIGGVGGYVTDQPPHDYRRIDVLLGLDSSREGVVLPSGRNVRVFAAPAHDIDVDWLSGCSMSYRRRALDVEPPDERYGATADRNGEDVQLSYRVRQHARLVVTPRARLSHRESAAGRRSVAQLTTVELVSRYERVSAGTGKLTRRAFWVSAYGQLGWYALKGIATFSRARLAIARATWRGIREIHRLRDVRGRATAGS
jgi:GT2 family glycosyltransferase